MRVFVACVLVLKIASCYGRFKRICVGNIEIAFFSDWKNFDDAKTSCRKYGGDLIKVGNSRIQTAIQHAITVKPQYYIGAKDDDGNNRYNWVVDDSVIGANPRIPSTGKSKAYQNWKSNQPNNIAEKCVVLGEHSVYTWSDVNCTIRYRYICQRDLIRKSTASKSVSCQTAVSTVGVRWEKNSAIVQSSNKNGVYQTIGTNIATLNFANANITEAGTYTCTTTSPSCSATKTHAISVDGTPTIQSVVGNKCTTFLYVTWKPNKAAIGFKHRIKALGKDTNFYAIPDSDGYITTEVRYLYYTTNYTVQIQVCETKDSCTTSFTAESSGTTGGVSDPVTGAILEYSDGCKATWNYSENSAMYRIKTTCTVNKYRNIEHRNDVRKTEENFKNKTFQFQPGGNRVCSATIWAKECGKISTPVKATGSCTTPPKEPEEIELLTIESSSASITIKMSKPREDNGLISCILIVLCYNKCSEIQFTVRDLEMAGQTDANNYTAQTNTVALAISMSSVSGYQISRKLSRGEHTSCDLYNTGLVAERSSSKVIEGNNVIENHTRNVWAYAVTSTPSEDTVLLQTSKPVVVLKQVQQQTTTAWSTTALLSTRTRGKNGSAMMLNIGWIIGLVGGFIAMVIIIVLLVIIVVRQRQVYTENHSTSALNSHTEAGNKIVMSQMQDNSPYEYENEPSGPKYEEIKSNGNESTQAPQSNPDTTDVIQTRGRLPLASQHQHTDSPYLNEPSNPTYEEIKESGAQDPVAYENFKV